MKTEFQCLHSGKCCEKVYTQIALTIGDVLRIAHFLNKPVKHLFDESIVGLKPFEASENIFEFEMGLTIPCKFRINQRCKIYDARPLNCRLFPYWILSEVSNEKIKEAIDDTYECVHSVKLSPESKERYKLYKDKIVEVLNNEADVTENILKKHELSFSVDLSKQQGFDKVKEKIMQLENEFEGVEFQKKIDELKIQFAISLVDNTKSQILAKVIVDATQNPSSAGVYAILDDLGSIELIKRGQRKNI